MLLQFSFTYLHANSLPAFISEIDFVKNPSIGIVSIAGYLATQVILCSLCQLLFKIILA